MTLDGSSPRISRRSTLRLIGVGGGMALLGAHQSAVAAATTSASAPRSKRNAFQESGAPRSGGTLRVGRPSDIFGPDGNVITQANFILLPQVYNTLTRYNRELQPEPELAESWEVSSDGKQLKLNLRKGVQFHSGREFTAEDVKYTTLRIREPELGVAQLRNMSAWISEIETPDRYTVVYKLDQPRPGIFDFLEYLYIVEKETVEGPEATRKAVGTGPFTFAEWLPGERLRLVKNENYWESGRPYLDEVVAQVIKDPQALAVQLEAEALDMVEGMSEKEAARLQQVPDFVLTLNEFGAEYYYIGADTTAPPLDNKKVRQAINYAIDRQRFVQSTLSGIGEPTAIPWPAHSPAFDSAKRDAYAFNLDQAKSLLQEAGVSNVELALSTYGGNPVLAEQAQILQADLAEIGVRLRVENLEPQRWSEKLTSATFEGLWSGPFGFSQMEPSSLPVMARPFNYKNNSSNFTSERYTQLVEAAISEIDVARREELYAQLTDLLLDESFIMPMSPRKQSLVLRSSAQGAEFRVTGMVRLQNAWMDA